MIDFAPWDSLLKQYVDHQGRVDYAQWQQESATDLDQWLAAISETEVSALNQEGAIAFFLNLYNALTIQQVLQRYPIQSIRPTVLGIPNWFTVLRFFTRNLYVLNGRSLSLNAIEHDILRKQFQEPRIHFALVCASIGCPLLRPEAYGPDRLWSQLENDAQRFINNPQKVDFEAKDQILYCSKIFKWYNSDFLTVTDSIVAYINQYHTDLKLSENVTIDYLPYDWNLNQRTSS